MAGVGGSGRGRVAPGTRNGGRSRACGSTPRSAPLDQSFRRDQRASPRDWVVSARPPPLRAASPPSIRSPEAQMLTSNPLVESWGHFPRSKDRMLDLLRRTDPAGLVILSGDVHHAELISGWKQDPGDGDGEACLFPERPCVDGSDRSGQSPRPCPIGCEPC